MVYIHREGMGKREEVWGEYNCLCVCGDDKVTVMMKLRPWRDGWIPRPRRLTFVQSRQAFLCQHLIRRLPGPESKWTRCYAK